MADDVEKIARGLTKAQRDTALLLLANKWDGGGRPSAGIAKMTDLGLMHIDVLKRSDGSYNKYRAYPTPLGAAVRSYLKDHEHG